MNLELAVDISTWWKEQNQLGHVQRFTNFLRDAVLTEIRGQVVEIDGYNVLLSVEAALGGGVLLPAQDLTLRDLAAMSRHYRRVEETRDALRLIGTFLSTWGASEVRWYLDRPVSNSGRLRGLMLEVAEFEQWPWQVELVNDPDPLLKSSENLVATADSVILDAGPKWLNLARLILEPRKDDIWWVDLTRSAP